jgi:hypothetical protein
MDPVVLDEIAFDPDLTALAGWLHIKAGSTRLSALEKMVERAKGVARPKAIHRVVRVDHTGEDHVVLDGTRFASRVLSVNLAETHRVFVYVATCGAELERWARTMRTGLDRFQADAIAGAALTAARLACFQQIEEIFHPGQLGEMNPGSLPDWPIREQRPLFDLLGDPEAAIGVQLLPSYLMSPTKTSSGLLFPAEGGYYNCQLCPMEDCPGRRAPYDPDLYQRKYQADR